MSIPASDGPATVTKPTPTPTAGARPGKSAATTPSSSTTTRPAPAPATRFDRTAPEDRPRPTLTDAVDRRRQSAATAPASSAPRSVDKASIARANASADAPKGPKGPNDGRAAVLRDGHHEGGRDDKIKELKDKKAELDGEGEKIKKDIKAVEDQIGSDETKSSIAGTVTDVVTSPVGAVAGLFGKKNPASEAVKSLVDKMTGLAGEKKDLEGKRDALADQSRAVEAQIRQLEHERVLNLFADTAQVTGMDSKVAKFMEEGVTTAGGSAVRLVVGKDTGTNSDGAYDSSNKSITVDTKTIDESQATFAKLREQGIVDEDGNIVDKDRFDTSRDADKVIKTVSLVGVHEVTHAVQDAAGSFDTANSAASAVLGQARRALTGSSTAAGAAPAGEAERVDAVEISAYQNQETNDLNSGAKKEAFVSVDASGKPLPAAQQVANVVAFELQQPLPFGPSKGYVREGDALNLTPQGIAGAASGSVALDSPGVAAGSVFANIESIIPGFRSPGDEVPGFRSPGFRSPGEEVPGFRSPGFRSPGEEVPGFRSPGFRSPGEEVPGFRSPGFRSPGEEVPGFRSPGFRSPGEEVPGFRSPGFRSPGEEVPGFRSPGFRSPGEEVPGFRSPGFRSPGLITE